MVRGTFNTNPISLQFFNKLNVYWKLPYPRRVLYPRRISPKQPFVRIYTNFVPRPACSTQVLITNYNWNVTSCRTWFLYFPLLLFNHIITFFLKSHKIIFLNQPLVTTTYIQLDFTYRQVDNNFGIKIEIPMC